jgi:hypothetical protein
VLNQADAISKVEAIVVMLPTFQQANVEPRLINL